MLLHVLIHIGFPVVALCQEWVSDKSGHIPQYAFRGGSQDGYSTYVCMDTVHGEPSSGKVNSRLGSCKIAWGNKEYSESYYSVLIHPPWATYTLHWETGHSKGSVPSGAVRVGSGIYVGRYKRDGEYIPGKIVSKHKALFYGYKGKEYDVRKGYESLVMTPRPISYYEIYDVIYDLESATETIAPDSQFITKKEVKNASPYLMSSTVSLEYTKTSSHSWTMAGSYKLERGKKTKVRAGVPRYAGVKHTWYEDETYTYSFKYGEDVTRTMKTSHEVTVRQPPFSDLYVSMVAKEAVVNVPFVATVKIVFNNGATYRFYKVPGAYDDIHQTSFETHVDDALPSDETKSNALKPSAVTSS
ncbi:Natterin-3 [Holothuria leucospilota]|uniref:Natterin-3 n=1 Tax=Holothuria leucospilota TaxID=206669 RepID=A0A9Q0YFH5_HOLLE|nr:Natterin-3 [Holothuria leucospilota]